MEGCSSRIENYLDLVAVAIGADMVPLVGENRTLCHFGLKIINSSPTTGLKAIIRGVNKPEITLGEVSFYIAPRINSAGRIKHGNNAVELLLEDNFDNAISFSKEIDEFNIQRRGLDKLITNEALEQIEENEEQRDFTTVVFKEDWHKGVIGIVASRLIEGSYKPTIVMTDSDEQFLTGSVRSVSGFDVYDALLKCENNIFQFGGHKYAAGLKVKKSNFESFKTQFENTVKDSVSGKMFQKTFLYDLLIDFSEITMENVKILQRMSPFGLGNKKPVFRTNNCFLDQTLKFVGEDDKHLKLSLSQANSEVFKSIGFGLGDKLSLIENKTQFKAVFNIDENNWNGIKSIQLKLLDIKNND